MEKEVIMANVLLENTNVFELKPEYQVEALRKRFGAEQNALKGSYNSNVVEKHRIQGAYEDFVSDKDATFDYDQLSLLSYKDELEDAQHQVIEKAANRRGEMELLDKYDTSFASLYQIKEQSEKSGEKVSFSFKEVSQDYPAGIITQEQYYEMGANPKGEVKQLALQVKLPEGERFDLLMPPYDKPGDDNKKVKAQIAFDEDALQALNADKLAKIMDFCESHGLSTFQMDVPYSFDGNIDAEEKMGALLQQLKEQASQKEIIAMQNEAHNIENSKNNALNNTKNVQEDAQNTHALYDEPQQQEVIETDSLAQSNEASNSVEMPMAQKKTKSEKTQSDAEAGFEKFLEGGLRKSRGFSYFKETSFSGWTKYIVYDKADRDNRKKDGRKDKSGEAKFTYSFKLFVKKEKGQFRFAYRTPGNKKIDDSVVNGMVGQFKDLGIKRVRFPDGLQDAEKKLWRIALAENGIVPVGMGLDKAKAEGMLKAAKEKLSAEAYIQYRYKLALQMEKDNLKKGKTVSPSEQDFIDSIKNSQKYMAFTEGYGGKLKGMLRDSLDAADINHDDGAIEKAAAYMAMRRLFDVYKETVDHADILGSQNLSNEEKQKIKAAGLTGQVSEFNPEQMGQLYEIMKIKSKADAKKEIDEGLLDTRDVNNKGSKGAKRADNVIIKEVFDGARNRFEKVNEILAPLGVDEISFPKSFGRLHYDNFYKEHPEFQRKAPQQSNTPQQTNPAPSKSAENSHKVKAFVQNYHNARGRE